MGHPFGITPSWSHQPKWVNSSWSSQVDQHKLFIPSGSSQLESPQVGHPNPSGSTSVPKSPKIIEIPQNIPKSRKKAKGLFNMRKHLIKHDQSCSVFKPIINHVIQYYWTWSFLFIFPTNHSPETKIFTEHDQSRLVCNFNLNMEGWG